MNHIERNENRSFGQPVIVGRRLTVFNVVSYISYDSMNIDEFLKDFEVSITEVHAAISYCKNRECKLISKPSDQYCDGCILRSISEGWGAVKGDFEEIDGISYSKDGKTIFLRSVEELEDEEFGVVGWLVAEKAEARLLNYF